MDYIEKLTGLKVNELLEVSQDREAWRELVVTCVYLQPPDYRVRERDIFWALSVSKVVGALSSAPNPAVGAYGGCMKIGKDVC